MDQVATRLDEIPLPTVQDYVDALRQVAGALTNQQASILKALLRAHHAAPGRVVSATKLAEEMRNHGFNFPNYNTVNLHYGNLARELGNALHIPPRDAVQVGVFVDFVPPDYASNTEYLWVLKQNVAEAIEQLNWVEQVSHLLYPHEALSVRNPATRVYGAQHRSAADGAPGSI